MGNSLSSATVFKDKTSVFFHIVRETQYGQFCGSTTGLTSALSLLFYSPFRRSKNSQGLRLWARASSEQQGGPALFHCFNPHFTAATRGRFPCVWVVFFTRRLKSIAKRGADIKFLSVHPPLFSFFFFFIKRSQKEQKGANRGQFWPRFFQRLETETKTTIDHRAARKALDVPSIALPPSLQPPSPPLLLLVRPGCHTAPRVGHCIHVI